VIVGKFSEDLAREHAAWLVEVAPVLRGGKRTFQMMRAWSGNSHFFGECPFPALMDESGSKRVAVLCQDEESLGFYFGV
jgi:hypothetical protein